MSRIRFMYLVMGLVCVVGLVMVDWAEAQPKQIVWQGQDVYVPIMKPELGRFRHPMGSGGFSLYWAKYIEKVTNGRLIVKIAPPGAIVPMQECFTATSKGAIQFTGIYASMFYTGIMPEAEVDGLPFAWETGEEQWDGMYNWGLYEELQKLYAKHNLYFIPVPCNTIYAIHTTFPIDTLDAIKGKKLRAAGIYGDLIRALGGSPVTIPWSEAYMGLKLGTIDGALAGVSGLKDIKLAEVVKYSLVSPSLSSIAVVFLINLDAFEALPKDIQEIIERDSKYVILGYSGSYNIQSNLILKWAQDEHGVKLVHWSPEDAARVRKIGIGLWDKVATKNANCTRLVGILREQMRALGKIK